MEADMFPSFDSMFSLFWVFFVIVAIFVIISFVLGFRRMLRYGGRVEDQVFSEVPQSPQVVREKEIIREVVKIRCSYCGTLYDENLVKCPNCGAQR